ncbi:MAG: YtxH domain-containing protein [Ignavibacteriales bacterium]|nr:YtxH domain-containing protein [Ignavibacteriales bacterium]
MLFGVIGAVIGFSYYFFIGCYNGTCLISSSPYISTLYGAGVGLVIAPSKKKTGE